MSYNVASMDFPELKQRSDVHLSRKTWHFAGVFFVIYLYLTMRQVDFLKLTGIFGIGSFMLDFFRLRYPQINAVVIRIFGKIMRQSETESVSGTSYMALGVFLTVLFFYQWPKVVVLSLIFLGTADPIASYFGIRYGKDRLFGRKSLQGSGAAFVVCVFVSGGFYLYQNLMTERLLVVSLVSGLAGSLAEAIPVGKLDDNLILPLLSSAFLWVIFYVFGGL